MSYCIFTGQTYPKTGQTVVVHYTGDYFYTSTIKYSQFYTHTVYANAVNIIYKI